MGGGVAAMDAWRRQSRVDVKARQPARGGGPLLGPDPRGGDHRIRERRDGQRLVSKDRPRLQTTAAPLDACSCLVAQRIYCYTTQVMVDASPLIYLAKLDALDVFGLAGHVPLITPKVERETARPGLAYRFPDALMIAEALRDGVLVRTELSEQERTVASQLGAEAGGLDAGESEVLAAAGARELPVLLHERRAIRMARSLGLETWSPVRLLIEGTPDRELSRTRVLEFARMVQMRFEDVEALVRRIEGTT